MAGHDLTTPEGRKRAARAFMWGDHGFLRLAFTNAHWIGPDMVRTNQPWPFQLRRWRDLGIRTVINLRGGFDSAYYAVEKAACEELGLTLIDAPLGSREAPSAARVLRAREIFQTIEYPALMHCKSGADRAGLMAVLYRHFHLGEPISVAMKELGLRTLHMRQGKTGVLDFVFDRYVKDVEPSGISFLDWVQSPDYDPDALKAEFQSSWLGTLLTEKLLRRE
ncbi:tyrosine-protein phosphatase [Brevundimonas sp. 2R-24]|uniref:Tyrosine-protein phosphatase n=1 Tax=Peiella sedimenti TaxID=3061083 RepID=A0ABT8SJP8_9CAUL|nr:tyrosine-protein phosphatase [Caulobacteraceae bacterium XZ-24]